MIAHHDTELTAELNEVMQFFNRPSGVYIKDDLSSWVAAFAPWVIKASHRADLMPLTLALSQLNEVHFILTMIRTPDTFRHEDVVKAMIEVTQAALELARCS